jgi:hypothetical protein
MPQARGAVQFSAPLVSVFSHAGGLQWETIGKVDERSPDPDQAGSPGRTVCFQRQGAAGMECDGLTGLAVAESILNAVAIYKKLRSTSRFRAAREYLYVIQSSNLEGLAIYSKGKLVKESGVETYYFLISAKRAL